MSARTGKGSLRMTGARLRNFLDAQIAQGQRSASAREFERRYIIGNEVPF